MAVKSLKSKYIKNVHPSETPLGIYKDADSKSFVAFDDQGGTEEIAAKQFVNTGSSALVTIDDLYEQGSTFTQNVTVNDIVGIINVQNLGQMNSGSYFEITVSNTFIKADSIIMLSKNGDKNSNKCSISVTNKMLGSFTIAGWVGWNLNVDFSINFIVINS